MPQPISPVDEVISLAEAIARLEATVEELRRRLPWTGTTSAT